MPSMAKTGSINRSRTNKLLHTSVSRHYHASPQMAWRLLTDTSLWPLWGPTVRGVRCSERFIRKGSEGQVRAPFGWWIPFVRLPYAFVCIRAATNIAELLNDKCRLILCR